MITFNPYDVFISRRNANSSSFEEYVLRAIPNTFIGFDSASNLIATTSSISSGSSVSSSYATTSGTSTSSSFSSVSNTASYALSTNIQISPSSSWASSSISSITSSYSHVSATSSFSINSNTSSYIGSGINNYIPKWLNNTLISSSNIYDNGTNVGIGTSNPGTLLHVQGNISASLLQGTSSFSTTSSFAMMALTSSYSITNIVTQSQNTSSLANTASYAFTASYIGTGINNYIPTWNNNRLTSTSSIFIDSTGSVGIGTTFPGKTLSVSGEILSITPTATPLTLQRTSTYINRWDFTISTHAGYDGGSLLIQPQDSEADLIFRDIGNTVTLVLDNSANNIYVPNGSLGVGNSNPGARLHVQGNISASSVTASLFGTSSWSNNSVSSLTASSITFVPTTSSYSLISTTSSYSLISTTSSYALNTPITSSYSLTASYALNVIATGSSSETSSYISGSIQFDGTSGYYPKYFNQSLSTTSSIYEDQSGIFINSPLYTTASQALTASWCPTAGNSLTSITSSYSSTASYALNVIATGSSSESSSYISGSFQTDGIDGYYVKFSNSSLGTTSSIFENLSGLTISVPLYATCSQAHTSSYIKGGITISGSTDSQKINEIINVLRIFGLVS